MLTTRHIGCSQTLGIAASMTFRRFARRATQSLALTQGEESGGRIRKTNRLGLSMFRTVLFVSRKGSAISAEMTFAIRVCVAATGFLSAIADGLRFGVGRRAFRLFSGVMLLLIECTDLDDY